MARLSSKKQLEEFSNNLKKLTDNLNDITNNVDDINKGFEDYNYQINDIKDNVISLESELKQFMHQVKTSPIIEKAKEEISKSKEELNKKYYKHDLIRKRFIEIINNIDNKELLLSNNEKANFNIPNFYLSYMLLYIDGIIKNNNKTYDKYLKEAAKINKEKTYLILMLINIKLNNEKEAIKYLNDYLNLIDPRSTNITIVKIIEYFKDNNLFLNKIFSKLDIWQEELYNDDNISNIILDNWFNILNSVNDNNENYSYTYQYVTNCYELIDNLNISNFYTSSYNKINDFIKNSNNNNKDILNDLIYSYDGNELEIRENIMKNEFIIKNSGINKEIKRINNKDIFTIFLICLRSNKYSKKTKEILLLYSKKYIEELFDNYPLKNNDDIDIIIEDWKSTTKDGSNENELINDITEYIKKPYINEINGIKIINFKTIYSFIFIIIGIIFAFIFSTIGISMIIVGIIMLVYFVFEITNNQNNIKKECDDKIYNYKNELYNLLAEIVDIKIDINKNINNKNKLTNYLNNLSKEVSNE